MSKELFLIGIGGTGMRCLEAFVHLCAMGMMDNQTINLLAIDTDFNNGNLERTRNLIENYIKVKSENGKQQKLKDSFFSAQLQYFEFTPEYTGPRANFREISRGKGQNEQTKRQNEVISNLLFDEKTQNFNLSHGYRAQTHLGSHLMYHSIKDELWQVDQGEKTPTENGLTKFIEKLHRAGDETKVFIMGSIFGGTGASSIPVIPRALRDALRVRDKSEEMVRLYGATLLTNYFSFAKPRSSQSKDEFVIADSNRFSLNSQAALTFYNEDLTIKRNYKRLYHIGWPNGPYDYDKKGQNPDAERVTSQTKTGGKDQKNPVHIIELICAGAAIHFFLDNTLTNQSIIEHVYKSVPYDSQTKKLTFGFEDVVDPAMVTKFMQKFSAFAVLALMIQNNFDGKVEDLIENLNISYSDFVAQHGYHTIKPDEFAPLNKFLASFLYYYHGGEVISTWLQQIQATTEAEDFLGFESAVYSNNPNIAKRVNWSQIWKNPNYHFPSKGGWLKSVLAKRAFEKFIPAFRGNASLAPEEEIQKRLEYLLNHIYRTINHLHAIHQ